MCYVVGGRVVMFNFTGVMSFFKALWFPRIDLTLMSIVLYNHYFFRYFHERAYYVLLATIGNKKNRHCQNKQLVVHNQVQLPNVTQFVLL